MGIGAILGFVMNPIEKWLEGRAAKRKIEAEIALELARAKAQTKIAEATAQAEIARRKATADVDWERIWSEQAAKSWKDEYWTVYLSIPAAMCFIPGLQKYALEGFQILAMTPDWYKAAFLTAISAAFGLRALTKWVKRKE